MFLIAVSYFIWLIDCFELDTKFSVSSLVYCAFDYAATVDIQNCFNLPIIPDTFQKVEDSYAAEAT